MPRNRSPLQRFADGGDVGYGDLIQEDMTPLINEPTQTMSMYEGGRVNLADGTDPSMREVLRTMGKSFTNPQHWAELGAGAKRAVTAIPSIVESLGRGAVAQAPGTLGDINELYLDLGGKPLFPNAPKAPTTREILDYVPRMTAPTEGAETFEDVGSFLAPGLGKLAGDTSKLLGKGADLTGDALVRAITGNPYATTTDVVDYASKFSPSQLITPAKGKALTDFNIAKADALLAGKTEQEARDIANMLTKTPDNPSGVFQLGDQIPTTFTRDPSFYDLPNTAMMSRSKPLTAGDLFPEWKAFEEAPTLKETSVEFKGMPTEYAGSYNPYNDRIRINSEKWMEALNDENLFNISPSQVDDAKRYVADSVFQHEVQHAFDVKTGQAAGVDPNQISESLYKVPYRDLPSNLKAKVEDVYYSSLGEVKGRLNPTLNKLTDEELLGTPVSKYLDVSPSEITTPREFTYQAPNYTPVPPVQNYTPIPTTVPDIVSPKPVVPEPVIPQADVGFTYTPQQVAQNPYAQIATATGGLGALGAMVNAKAEEAPQIQEPASTPSDDFWTKFFESFNSYQEPSYGGGYDISDGYDTGGYDYEMYNYDIPTQPEYVDYTGGYTEFDYKRGGRVHDDIARMRAELLRKKK